MAITIEQILRGVGVGRVQSVGHMGVVPLVDDAVGGQDETFAPPNVGVSNSMYGTVDIENSQDRPTIVPTGAGWITKRAAQDHAIAGAVLIKKTSTVHVDTAMCIESTQGGYLAKGEHDMIILPAALRAPALAMRKTTEYGKLWESIGMLNATYTGTSHMRQHMADFIQFFEKELDEFVAQFELVPNQIGAIVVIGDRVVGIERAPNVAFWRCIWPPLIRVCYGSLAVRARRMLGTAVPSHRTALQVTTRSLEGLAHAIAAAQQESQRYVESTVNAIGAWQLQSPGFGEGSLDDYEIVTLASDEVSGQIVRRGTAIPYASLCRPYDPRHETF